MARRVVVDNEKESVLYAGIDGGGSKTELVLVDGSGLVVARKQTTTSNPSIIGHEAATQVLTQVFHAALANVPGSPRIARAWFGLSGAGRQAEQDALRPLLAGLADEITITNDAELLIGSLPRSIGVVVIGGTGSIALGVNEAGERARAGGWGHIFGDQGSGYGLVREAFRVFSLEADGRKSETALTEVIAANLGLKEPQDLIAWVYNKATTKQDIARLAPLVLKMAELGDEVAERIVREGAKELVELIVTLGRRLRFERRLPVGLGGGLLVNNGFYRDLVTNYLQQFWGDVDRLVIREPALAAARSLIPVG